MVKQLGQYADELYLISEEIKDLKSKLTQLDENRKELKKEVMSLFSDSKQTIAAGSIGKLTLKEKDIPIISPDKWHEFYDYVYENKAIHLLQKRLAVMTVMELLNGGEVINGVDILTKQDLLIGSVAVKL